MKILYLESISGIAGDMFAAGFLNAGLVTIDELNLLAEKLGAGEVTLRQSQVLRSAIQATHLEVLYDHNKWLQRFCSHETGSLHAHIHFRDLEDFIFKSSLTKNIKTTALKIIDILAEAEARCHQVSKQEVAFHELGMLDSLLDIVMAAYCLDKVKADVIMASPIKLGRGYITTAHGTQPVPPPVSADLAGGMLLGGIPDAIEQQNIELTTPTGLAILKALDPIFSTEWPAGEVIVSGRGAGTMDFPSYPNLFRISLIQTKDSFSALPYDQDKIIEMSVNFDDATAEQLAWVTKKLFALGAVDVWQTTATGKKGRVLIILSALIEEKFFPECADFILRKTTTFGLRYKKMERLKLSRYFEKRHIGKKAIQFKIGLNNQGKKIKEKIEFEDLKEIWDNDLNTKDEANSP